MFQPSMQRLPSNSKNAIGQVEDSSSASLQESFVHWGLLVGWISMTAFFLWSLIASL